MEVHLYNTLTRSIDGLTRSHSDKYKIYCCGPTVYNYAHIGNFRTFIAQDVLFRLLKICGYNTLIVRNITDVDDKTIKFSQQNGVSLKSFTKKWEDIFHSDCDNLNMLRPDFEPRAAEHIDEQIALISTLLEKGLAYKAADGSVYFSVSKFNNYGKLSRVKDRELRTQELDSAGKKNLADEYDRDSASDFALWKAMKPEDGENFWDSPFGAGRPGWHIECSAMAMKYLGEEIDLHSGGMDLCFPHHENEIAQSEGCTGKKFARHWMHIAHLMVDGTKMSKSLGNLYTLNDIVARGFSPQVLRYCLISGHYRQPLNFTFNALNAAKNALKKLLNFAKKINLDLSKSNFQIIPEWKFFGDAFSALCDDLNCPQAIGCMFKTIGDLNIDDLSQVKKFSLRNEFGSLLYIFGIDLLSVDISQKDGVAPAEIIALADERIEAKKNKDFESADELREKINSLGWAVKDTAAGYELHHK